MGDIRSLKPIQLIPINPTIQFMHYHVSPVFVMYEEGGPFIFWYEWLQEKDLSKWPKIMIWEDGMAYDSFIAEHNIRTKDNISPWRKMDYGYVVVSALSRLRGEKEKTDD